MKPDKTDVFGLGAVRCVLLTGQPPYLGQTAEAIRLMAVRGQLADAFTRLDSCGAETLPVTSVLTGGVLRIRELSGKPTVAYRSLRARGLWGGAVSACGQPPTRAVATGDAGAEALVRVEGRATGERATGWRP